MTGWRRNDGTPVTLARAAGFTYFSDDHTANFRSRREVAVHINWRIWNRKLHRWGAILIALPFLAVVLTGILLQLKKEWSWVQPPTARGKGKAPEITMAQLLDAAKSVPEAEIKSWDDVDRIDLQPGRGMAKVQAKNRWEVQVDLQTAAVLQAAYRRSDLIESLHDGSWFHDKAKLFIFLPTAFVVFGLWVTGVYLFFLPHWVKWSRRRQDRDRAGDAMKAR